MKKILLAALMFCATPALAEESAFERITASGTIKCGFAVSPPVLLKDPNTGKFSGMDYEIWENIGRNLGLNIEWVQASGWGTFAEDLKQGKYDAFCTQIWMNPPRTKFLTTTIPIAYRFLYAYVRPDDRRFNQGLDTLNTETVGIPIMDGDITEDMAKTRFPKAKRYSLPNSSNWSDMYMAVTTKKADVFFADTTAYGTVAAANEVKLKKLDTPPAFVFGSRFSMAQGEYQFRDMVNVVLQSMVDDGSLGKITQKTAPDMTTPVRNYQGTR